MSDTSGSLRVQRRARMRAAILEAARQEFARRGYQKATIRAVAERAGCDPSLVMQHFGSKQKLFRAAAELDLDLARLIAQASMGPPDAVGERLVRAVFERMDERSEATASTLRSMLTHDESAEEALKLFNLGEIAQVLMAAGAAGDERNEWRGGLVGALLLGTAIHRYVLKFSVIEQAGIDDLVEHMRPAVEALLQENGPGVDRRG